MDDLEVIYQDPFLVAINKPHGLFTHRSKLSGTEGPFALQKLRDQIGSRVYPVHRLDRKTGGVLIFALDKDTDSKLQVSFALSKVRKKYLAIVRGFTQDSGGIDYPLRNDNGKLQEATTCYKTIARTELDIPCGKFETSRYSLVAVIPQTGRMHQIRKHFAHINHPVIADRPHGCNKQNKLFKELWNMDTMLLHAREYSFKHPHTKEDVSIKADMHDEFRRMLNVMEWQELV